MVHSFFIDSYTNLSYSAIFGEYIAIFQQSDISSKSLQTWVFIVLFIYLLIYLFILFIYLFAYICEISSDYKINAKAVYDATLSLYFNGVVKLIISR